MRALELDETALGYKTMKIVITPLHEDEVVLAHTMVTPVHEEPDGMIVAFASQYVVDQLRAANVLVEVLPSASDRQQQGYQMTGGSSLEAVTGPLPAAPIDVAIACDGPIQPGWTDELTDIGLTRVARGGGDKLTAHVPDDAAMQALAAIQWVIGLQPVATGPAPTPVRHLPIGGPEAPAADDLWDVAVSDAFEQGEVERWANDNGLAIVGSSERRVRLRVPPEAEGSLDQLGYPAERFSVPTFHNNLARELIGVPSMGVATAVAGLTLRGAGEIVGVADSGLDDTHEDFADRIVKVVPRARPTGTDDGHGHGTHVAGTILGSGKASGGLYTGIAPEASLYFQAIADEGLRLTGIPVDLRELFQQAWDAGARVHNNSWGSPVQGNYTGYADDVDEFVHAHPDMLIVISAGNDGSTKVDPNLPSRREAGRVQPLSIGSPATCKNGLVVGAARSSRSQGGYSQLTHAAVFPDRFMPMGSGSADVAVETVSGDTEQPAGFSSRGPCTDRRIKPDVLAPGTDIVSTRSSQAPDSHFWSLAKPGYAVMGGTSMAAPVVSGVAAIVRQYYRQVRLHDTPSAALLKATIINGTRTLTGGDAGGDVPNPDQGFGAIHVPNTLPSRPGMRLAFVDVGATQTEAFARTLARRRYTFETVSPGELRVCLAFTDPPARALQNDLDLVVELPITREKRLGNSALRDRLTAEDSENNVEIVRIADAPAGRWTVAIVCRNLLKGPQGFALVVTGQLKSDEVSRA